MWRNGELAKNKLNTKETILLSNAACKMGKRG